VKTDKIQLYIIDDFLSHELCDRLISQIRRNHRPSTITSDDEPDKKFRTSQTCDFDLNNISVKETDSQICEYLGIPSERSESIQGQYYRVGNEFKSHTDWFDPYHPKEWVEYGADRGQRTWTFMIYLNDVEEGGSTYFPKIDRRIYPKRGRAVAWLNIDEMGRGNRDTLHWGTPIIKGEKFIITKWFRTRGNLTDPFKMYIGDQIPALTRFGFQRSQLSPSLFQRLRHFYQSRRNQQKVEKDYAVGTFIQTETDIPPTLLLPITSDLDEALRGELLGQLENWVGKKLEWTATYGIRTYQRGSHLKMHRDRYMTHIVSGIINVDQKCDRDWPLVLVDNYGRRHDIILKPGEVVFYESARCRHGRPYPFKGDSFSNIFFHTRPLYWEEWITPYDKEVKGGDMLFE
jgi:prolyl 4-hydroxylase